MQAFGQRDERAIHVRLMDSLIGSALTSEAGKKEDGLIQGERGWRGRLSDEYCECKNP